MLQFKTSIFYGWRLVARDLKNQRTGLMIRAWNSLRKNRQHAQIKRYSTQLILRRELGDTESLIRECFNALKLNKEREKCQLVTTELKDNTEVAIESTGREIKKLRDTSTRSQKQRQLNAVCNGFGVFVR